MEWATLPSCGGVVCFAGTVRDSSDGRPGVTALTYEAYEEQAVIRLQDVADEARRRWPDTVRLVMLHRTGRLELREASVIVVAPPGPGLRSGPLLHRHAEGDRPHLEGRRLGGRFRLGPGRARHPPGHRL